MSTLTVILQPDADGTLRLPVPEELRAGKVKVTAILEPAEPPSRDPAAPRSPVKWPDFAAIRREIFGDDLEKRRLSPEDSAFIRDRGDR